MGFQREFEHSDALRLFEILSCDHLELISQQVDRAHYRERRTRKISFGEVYHIVLTYCSRLTVTLNQEF